MFQVEIRSHPLRADLPDVGLLRGVAAAEVLAALQAAAGKLADSGIRHALAGALAVGAHGCPRAERKVEFLLGPEAFSHHPRELVTLHPGVPIRVGNVAVDPISIGPQEGHLLEAVSRAKVSNGIRVLPLEALVYMKLKSPRAKDEADVVELLKAGIDARVVEKYLASHAPDLVARFARAIERAKSE